MKTSSSQGKGKNKDTPFSLSHNTAVWLILAVVLGYLVYHVRGMLTPFVLGGLMAYVLNPSITRLASAPLRLPRALATGVMLLVTGVILFGMGALLFPILHLQVENFAGRWPVYQEKFLVAAQELLTMAGIDPAALSLRQHVQQINGDNAAQVFGLAEKISSGVLGGLGSLLGTLSLVILVPIVTFFFALQWPSFIRGVDQLLPRKKAPVIRRLARDINTRLKCFVRGQSSVCVLMALYYGVGLSVIGLDFAWLMAVLSGVLIFIPYVGSVVTGVLMLALGYAQFGTGELLVWLAALYGVGQFVEGNVATPHLVGREIGLHPLWIIFALMLGGHLLGFLGVLIAVPVLAVASVLVEHAVAEYKKSRLYSQ